MKLSKIIKNNGIRFEVSKILFQAFKNLSATGRSVKQVISMAVDASLCAIALWLAFSLRLGYYYANFEQTWYLFLLLPVSTVLLCTALGIYRWVVRTSTDLLSLQIAKASIASALFLLLILYFLPPTESVPRSLFVIYGLIFGFLVNGARYVWRWAQGQNSGKLDGEPVAIFGAGAAGEQLVRLMLLSPAFKPVFFIDDKQSLTNKTVSGLRVYSGSDRALKSLFQKYEISKIVLALPSVKGEAYTDVLNRMTRYSLPVLTTPSVTEIVNGSASPDEIRDIRISDILGRSQIEPDGLLLRSSVEDKVVLVTGGGGSIGSEICRQIVELSADKLIILEQSESNLYSISEEIHNNIALIASSKNRKKVPKFVPVLGSVCDKEKINTIFQAHNVQTVFHAAAYKHVPIVEQYPEEGIRTNIFGTKNVLDVAIDNNAEKFVLISSDKAVRPTNVMGATKRVAELTLQHAAKNSKNTTICMVRFGNVLGSSGSVVPKFSQQIKSGGPITITHPDITRYFMTIPEASQLVLQASSIARQGDVLVLDMGEPVRIMDLAKKMVNLYGKSISSNQIASAGEIAIEITGLRPGEKMYEELFISGTAKPTIVSKILREHNAAMIPQSMEHVMDKMKELVTQGRFDDAKKMTLELASSKKSETHNLKQIDDTSLIFVNGGR